jgi:hypothetical protein
MDLEQGKSITGEGDEMLLKYGWVRMSGAGNFEVWDIRDRKSKEIVEDYFVKYPARELYIDYFTPRHDSVRITAEDFAEYGLGEMIDQSIKFKSIYGDSKGFKQRVGKCYMLTGRYVMDHPDAILVHGTINGMRFTGKNFDNPHAWIEEGDNVKDLVLDQQLPRDIYYEVFGAKPVKKYTSDEARLIMIQTGNFGPWGENKTATLEDKDLQNIERLYDSYVKGIKDEDLLAEAKMSLMELTNDLVTYYDADLSSILEMDIPGKEKRWWKKENWV